MKRRLSYVSNSSSTSFCIVGICVEYAKFDLSLNKDEMKRRFIEETRYEEDQINGWDDANLLYKFGDYFGFDEIAKDLDEDFVVRKYVEYDEHVAGMPITKMRLDETLLQFKTRVLEELKKIGFKGTVDDVEIIIDGGRDS